MVTFVRVGFLCVLVLRESVSFLQWGLPLADTARSAFVEIENDKRHEFGLPVRLVSAGVGFEAAFRAAKTNIG